MKHKGLILAVLVLCAVNMLFLLIGPVDQYAEDADSEIIEEQRPELVFDLKYDKYLVAAPYTYTVGEEERAFRFENMRDALAVADRAAKDHTLAYVDNYKNRNGKPPAYNGKNTDAFGTSRSASVPAYIDTEDLSEFIYIEDGTLVKILGTTEKYVKVSKVGDVTESEYFVPTKYIDETDTIIALKKAVVIDRKNQNEGVFEKYSYTAGEDEEEKQDWKVVSYSLATTGKEGKYHKPTPLGYYFAIEKKPKFFYVKDGTTEIEGYAPYAVRFSAGAYIHGVASEYKYAEDGSRIDRGIYEFSNSIGTIPLSHKCVRNYTSHAKFIYDWYEHGYTIVVVIE